MSFLTPLLTEIRRTLAEMGAPKRTVQFRQLSREALFKDREATAPELLKRGNKFADGLFFSGLAVGALCASTVATPVLIAAGYVSAAIAKYVSSRYYPAEKILTDNALSEGASPDEAREHVQKIRKLSNGFNAPLDNLKQLSSAHLATENAPPVGPFTFVGKTTNALRQTVAIVYDTLPMALKFRMKALRVNMRAYQDISQDNTGQLPDDAYVIGSYSDSKSSHPRTSGIVGNVLSTKPSETASMDTAYLNGDAKQVTPVQMRSSFLHQAARSMDDTLLLGKGSYSRNRRFLRSYRIEFNKLAIQNNWDLDTRKNMYKGLLSPETVFASSFQQAYNFPAPDAIDYSGYMPNTSALANNVATSHEWGLSTGGEALWSFFYHIPSPRRDHRFMSEAQGNQVAAQQMLLYIMAMEDGAIRRDWIETWKKKAPLLYVHAINKKAQAFVKATTPPASGDRFLLELTNETLAARAKEKPKRPRKSLAAISGRHRFHIV